MQCNAMLAWRVWSQLVSSSSSSTTPSYLPDKIAEPIIPFVSKLQALKDANVSCVLVLGSSSSFFEHADRVIMMEQYRALDVTGRVVDLCREMPGSAVEQVPELSMAPRKPAANSLNALRGDPKRRVDKRSIAFPDVSDGVVDLTHVKQVESREQAEAIACALSALCELAHQFPQLALVDLLQKLDHQLDERGISHLHSYDGGLVRPRALEVGAAVNRLRCVKMIQMGETELQPESVSKRPKLEW